MTESKEDACMHCCFNGSAECDGPACDGTAYIITKMPKRQATLVLDDMRNATFRLDILELGIDTSTHIIELKATRASRKAGD